MKILLAIIGYAFVISLWIVTTRKLMKRNGMSIGAAVEKHRAIVIFTAGVTLVLVPAPLLLAGVFIALCVAAYFVIKRLRLVHKERQLERKERRQSMAIQAAVNKRDAHYKNVRIPTSYIVTDPRILD